MKFVKFLLSIPVATLLATVGGFFCGGILSMFYMCGRGMQLLITEGVLSDNSWADNWFDDGNVGMLMRMWGARIGLIIGTPILVMLYTHFKLRK